MNKNTLTFDKWAILGKDEGMEKGHHASVSHMLKSVFDYYQKKQQKYSIIDFGCGNGWVVRNFKAHSLCYLAHGIDASKEMIKKAQNKDLKESYFNQNIETWENEKNYDVVFSMETLYYFKNPSVIINKIYDDILNENGMLIMGIDHYAENPESLNWGKQFNLDIVTLSIDSWLSFFESAGFNNISYKQVEAKNAWNGTLVIKGYKK